MNDALLNFALREHRFYSIVKTGKSVYAGDQDIIYTSVFHTVHDSEPKFRAFILTDPHAHDFFGAIKLNSDSNINCFFDDDSFRSNMKMDAVHKYNGIDFFKRT